MLVFICYGDRVYCLLLLTKHLWFFVSMNAIVVVW